MTPCRVSTPLLSANPFTQVQVGTLDFPVRIIPNGDSSTNLYPLPLGRWVTQGGKLLGHTHHLHLCNYYGPQGEKGPQIKCLFTYNIMKVNRTSVFLKTQENHDFLGKWAKHSRMPPSTAPPVVVRHCSPTWMMSCGALHCL